MILYALLFQSNVDAKAFLETLATWVADNVFDNAAITIDDGSTTLFRWDVSVQLTTVSIDPAYQSLQYAIGLTPSDMHHELAVPACWDVLGAVAAYEPLPVWLSAEVWPMERLRQFASLTPLQITGDIGHVLSADDFARLIDGGYI